MKALKRKIVVFGLIWFSLFLIAANALQEFGSIADVLVWIAVGGGAMVLFGYFEAMLLENFGWWHNLPTKVKLIVPLAFAAGVGFLAQSALALELPTAIPPQVEAVILMLINWVFSQRAYAGIKDSSYGA